MRFLKLTVLAVIPVLAAACSPVGFLNVITPSSSFSLAKNIPYGELDRQKLDIYEANNAKPDSPVIVFLHGGSWKDGSKDIYKFLGDGLAREGYNVVVPNYRLYPEAIFPGFIEDAALATAYAAKRYPGRSLSLIGHSAGGHMVTLLGTAPQYLEAAGVNMCERVSSVVGLAAPTGVSPLTDEPFISIFPERFGGKDAPLNNVDSPSPAMFLMNGGKDDTVGPLNSEKLAAAINARGGKAVYKYYPKLTHTDPVKVMSKYFDGDSTLKADILSFVDLQGRSKTGFCQ